jgi:hypothetical protein
VTATDAKGPVFIDADGDGWDDMWRATYLGMNHRDRTRDTDGDGLTDYEEMLRWGHPYIAGAPKLTPAEEALRVAVTAEQQRQEWARRQAALAPVTIAPMKNARGEPASREEIAAEKRARLLDLAADLQGKAAGARARVDEFTQRLGLSKSFVTPSGGVAAIVDVVGGQPQSYVTHNTVAADTISTDEVRAGGNLGLNLNGLGFVMGMWDGGDVLLNHQEFVGGQNMVIDRDGPSTLGIQGHPTHVAGTLAARGGVAIARGMSPSGTVDAYDFIDDALEMAIAAAPVNFHLSNHSYGQQRGWGILSGAPTTSLAWWGNTNVSQTEDYQFGFYGDLSRAVDQITYDAPHYLPVWAAGNDRGLAGNAPATQPATHWAFNGAGFNLVTNQVRPADHANNAGFDLLTAHGVSKNVLTVAAVGDLVGGYMNAGGVAVGNFSSFGPVDDGRIKPDLSANGVGVLSTWNNATNGYANLDGTSMAAPGVTGSLNLLVQHYANLFGSADTLRSATLKALAIHTADEAGANPGPDYTFGWGLMNTRTAAQLLTQQQQSGNALTHLKQVTLNQGGLVEFPVRADGNALTPLRVTLCWTDPPGVVPPLAVDANVPALINDLDLRITQGANTFFPWRLNPALPAAAALNNGDNTRDNVEVVNIASPVSGQTYLIRVTHKGTLRDDTGATAPQQLSLVVSGVDVQPAPEFAITQVTKTGATQYSVLWGSVVGSTYRLETSTDLNNWTIVPGDISATQIQTSVPVSASIGEDKRFWRVRRLP